MNGVTGIPSRQPELLAAVSGLLTRAGVAAAFALQPLAGGANNRVYRVEAGGQQLLLKVYFQHPGDTRDRLGAEFAFAAFAWSQGLRALPQPIAQDPQARLGLYEFISGRPVTVAELDEGLVGQACAFIRALNVGKDTAGAAALPVAADAHFTLAGHLGAVEARLARLREVETSAALAKDAVGFIRGELVPASLDILAWARRRAMEPGLSLGQELPLADRCLSPSDFGFHNAILPAASRLRFIDFEYAGWDDPAKLICDFFCQPEVPVTAERYYEPFVAAALERVAEPEWHRARVALLLPVCRLKWCCIMLNEFLPEGRARHRFARGPGWAERAGEQLQKARRGLQELLGYAP